MDQHREPGAALDEGADGGALQSDDQIAFPVAWDRSFLDLGGPLADQHVVGDVVPGSASDSSSGGPQRTPGSQAGDQFTLQRAASIDIEGLVDGLVADPHGLIIGEVDRQTPRDLFGAPGLHPASVTSMWLVLALPLRTLRAQHPAIGRADPAREADLDVVSESVVAGELGDLGSASPPLGVPLRDRRFVFEPESSGRSVPAQLPRDRRRRPPELASDLAHTEALGAVERDVLTLTERQITARHSRTKTWVHTASVAEPPVTNGR